MNCTNPVAFNDLLIDLELEYLHDFTASRSERKRNTAQLYNDF